jgi:hypothetical protein
MKIIKDFDLDDVFLFSEILDKMELNVDIDKMSRKIQTSKLENKDDVKSIGKEVVVSMGADLVVKFMKGLYKAKIQVKQFIANMTGLQLDAVGKMGLKEIKEFFTELINHEGFGDFLSQAGELTE